MRTYIEKTTDLDPFPAFYGLRLRWWDGIGMNSFRAATLRWRASNARQPVLCLCGAPGEYKVHSLDGFGGDVAPYYWRCDEHASVPLDVPWRGGRPAIGLSREACWWRTGPIVTGLVRKCGCGTHVGEAIR